MHYTVHYMVHYTGFNSEAFHHLNVALRLCGQRAAAVEETWCIFLYMLVCV